MSLNTLTDKRHNVIVNEHIIDFEFQLSQFQFLNWNLMFLFIFCY
jgi:hypothetical protein